ncbi:MAG: hypothetical protein AAB430_00120 [Patescibacteria group bacterium]
MKKLNSGQSLVEMVVAVGMMSLLMVALLSVTSLSIKNTRLAQSRTQAVGLVQEGVELMRAYRDFNWNGFYAKANGQSYVLLDNWTVETGLTQTGCSQTSYFDASNFFSRCVKLSTIEAGNVSVEVTVYWQEGSQLKQVVQSTNLSLWEI